MTVAFLADQAIDTATVHAPGLRRQIDRSVMRALFDRDYEQRLLRDPTIAVEDRGCPPQEFKALCTIRALNVDDFARQAYALFWPMESNSSYLEDELPLAAAAR
jgi:hypothetical protein